MSKIPVAKTRIPEELFPEIKRVLKSGKVSDGEYVKELEETYCKVLHANRAVAVGSCTAGLQMVIEEAGFNDPKGWLRKPRRVGVPAFTWPSTYQAIRNPVWMDVELDDWAVSYETLEDADAYVLVFPFGKRIHLSPGNKPVIADAAHAFGSGMFDKRYLAEVYSLSPSKTFTGVEGGVIVTDDEWLYERLKSRRSWFSRLEEVNALVGDYWAGKVEEIVSKKEKLFQNYVRELKDLVGNCLFFQEIDSERSNYNTIGLRFFNAKTKQAVLGCSGVQFKHRYDLPREAVKGRNILNIPNSVKLRETLVEIPSYLGVDYETVAREICKHVGGVFNEANS